MLIVMPTNAKSYIIDCFIVHMGASQTSPVCFRDVFKSVIASGGCAVILAHNHPSGVCEPSIGDDAVTNQLVLAGRMLEIQVLDHIIIGDGQYYSYSDTGKIAQYEMQAHLTIKHIEGVK